MLAHNAPAFKAARITHTIVITSVDVIDNALLLHTTIMLMMLMYRLVFMRLKSGVQKLQNNHGNVWVHISQIELILQHGSCGVSSNVLRDDCND
jgi:uncharacterized membrane protein